MKGEHPMVVEDNYVAGNPRFAGSPFMVVLTGCSGSGKSTLLSALGDRGWTVVPEAGRQIVKEQLLIGGDALPWADQFAFAALLASRIMYLFNSARPAGRPVIFDRGLVDVIAHYAYLRREPPATLTRAVTIYRYAPRVLLSPPWEAVFAADSERRKDFAQALQEYEALVATYARLGYRLVEIPRLPVADRLAFVEAELEA
jgi:predicted ATPase